MLTVKAPSGFAIEEVTELSSFIELEEEWNALVDTTCGEPFYRHEFLRTWLHNFAPGERLSVLLGREGGGRLVAALPLLRKLGVENGLRVRQAISTSNSHSCRFDLIAEDGILAGKSFFEHLSRDSSWDVLRIGDVPVDGNARHLQRAAEAAGWPVGTWESQRSPYLLLPSSYEALLGSMDSHFRSNVRRHRRRLEALGTVTVERISGETGLQERLEECFAVEQKSWKGAEGTAILQGKGTYGFYSELAAAAAAGGYLSLFLLRVNGQLAAFQYGLLHEGVYSMPKIGFDPAFEAGSPGLVLLESVLRDCIERGLNKCDFLGMEMPWKKDWTQDVKRHDWLFIYRNGAYGRALREVKFSWIPAAKRLLERWSPDNESTS